MRRNWWHYRNWVQKIHRLPLQVIVMWGIAKLKSKPWNIFCWKVRRKARGKNPEDLVSGNTLAYKHWQLCRIDLMLFRRNPKECFCISGRCENRRWECHDSKDCKEMKKCKGKRCVCEGILFWPESFHIFLFFLFFRSHMWDWKEIRFSILRIVFSVSNVTSL